MDENKNPNKVNEQQPETSPFTNEKFYIAYGLTFIAIIALSSILTGGIHNWIMGAWSQILVVIIGIIAWAMVRGDNKAVALGILLGSITPFVILFLLVGAC